MFECIIQMLFIIEGHNMKKLFKTTLASALLMVSAFASAVTVKDAKVNLPW